MPRKNHTTGDTMHKQVHFKIIVGEKVFRHTYKAEKKHYYTEEDIDNILSQIVEYCEKKLPLLDFRMVQLSEADFNIIATGLTSRQLKEKINVENKFQFEVFQAGVKAFAGIELPHPAPGGADQHPGQGVGGVQGGRERESAGGERQNQADHVGRIESGSGLGSDATDATVTGEGDDCADSASRLRRGERLRQHSASRIG